MRPLSSRRYISQFVSLRVVLGHLALFLMSLSCNAVGDIIALVQLGIKIAEVLSESRNAPAACRALCNDLRSLERLIAISRPTIDGLKDHTLQQLVSERLDDVSHQRLDGLKLICNFDTAFDVSAHYTEPHWRQTLRYWVKMSKQSITWTLNHNASARDARVSIAQSFTSLIFAVLVCVLEAQTHHRSRSKLSIQSGRFKQTRTDFFRHCTILMMKW